MIYIGRGLRRIREEENKFLSLILMYQLSDIIVVKEISYNTFLNKINPEIGIYEIFKSSTRKH